MGALYLANNPATTTPTPKHIETHHFCPGEGALEAVASAFQHAGFSTAAPVASAAFVCVSRAMMAMHIIKCPLFLVVPVFLSMVSTGVFMLSLCFACFSVRPCRYYWWCFLHHLLKPSCPRLILDGSGSDYIHSLVSFPVE